MRTGPGSLMLTGGISGPGTSSPPHLELRQVTVGAGPLAHTASISAPRLPCGDRAAWGRPGRRPRSAVRWGLCSEGTEFREKLGAQQPARGRARVAEPEAAALPWPAVNLSRRHCGSRWQEGPAPLPSLGPVRSLGHRCLSHIALRRAVPPMPRPLTPDLPWLLEPSS